MSVKDIIDFLKRNSDDYFTVNEIAQELSMCNSNICKQMIQIRAISCSLEYRCRVIHSGCRRGTKPTEYRMI